MLFPSHDPLVTTALTNLNNPPLPTANPTNFHDVAATISQGLDRVANVLSLIKQQLRLLKIQMLLNVLCIIALLTVFTLGIVHMHHRVREHELATPIIPHHSPMEHTDETRNPGPTPTNQSP